MMIRINDHKQFSKTAGGTLLTRSSKDGRYAAKKAMLFFIYVALLCTVCLLSLLEGTPRLTLTELSEVLSGGGERLERLVVFEIRLPRLIIGMLAGMMLSVTGTLMQDALKNHLAGPELLGVSSGASVVMVGLMVLHVPVSYHVFPSLAMLGGLAGGAAVIWGSRGSKDPVRLVLIGAAISAFIHSLVIAMITLGTSNDIHLLFLFLFGSLANRTWQHVEMLFPWAVVGIVTALFLAKSLNVFRLGDESAVGLGVKVHRIRFMALIVGVVSVSAVVSVCGPIAFIALLAPHLARRLFNTHDTRYVLPLSALLGMLLLSSADLISRYLFAPVELPVGILTTLLGGPVLIGLFWWHLRGYRS
jgi:iron complex transport system permease protein